MRPYSLNVTPDHLDRHGSMEDYVAVKTRIFARQGAGDVAIVGVDEDMRANKSPENLDWRARRPGVGGAASR